MGTVGIKQHAEISGCLQGLKAIIAQMRSASKDVLLIRLSREIDDWISFAASHNDVEELGSLKEEIFARFYQEYNVRIEPKELDEKRLDAFNDLMSKLNALN